MLPVCLRCCRHLAPIVASTQSGEAAHPQAIQTVRVRIAKPRTKGTKTPAMASANACIGALFICASCTAWEREEESGGRLHMQKRVGKAAGGKTTQTQRFQFYFKKCEYGMNNGQALRYNEIDNLEKMVSKKIHNTFSIPAARQRSLKQKKTQSVNPA